MLLILHESGIPVFTKQFQENSRMNTDLIAPLLAAINTFSHQIFDQKLDRIKIGRFTLVIIAQGNLLWCYLFEGPSYYARRHLENFVLSIYAESREIRNYLYSSDVSTGLDESIITLIHQKIDENFPQEGNTRELID